MRLVERRKESGMLLTIYEQGSAAHLVAECSWCPWQRLIAGFPLPRALVRLDWEHRRHMEDAHYETPWARLTAERVR